MANHILFSAWQLTSTPLKKEKTFQKLKQTLKENHLGFHLKKLRLKLKLKYKIILRQGTIISLDYFNIQQGTIFVIHIIAFLVTLIINGAFQGPSGDPADRAIVKKCLRSAATTYF